VNFRGFLNVLKTLLIVLKTLLSQKVTGFEKTPSLPELGGEKINKMKGEI